MSSTWSRNSTLKFIKKYRSLDSIWKTKSKDYHNIDKRDAAYTVLLELVKKFDPQATKDTVIRKINNLRTAFRRELKKVKFAQRSGMRHVPRLWYYPDLLFLLDREETLEGTSNVERNDQVNYNTVVRQSHHDHTSKTIIIPFTITGRLLLRQLFL